jgi:hypothetical protein
MSLKFAKLFAVPVLAALALTSPGVVAPETAPAARAATEQRYGPFFSKAAADAYARRLQAQYGAITEVYGTDAGTWFVKATYP